ncbi:hypothetical protein [Lactiplantibacillus paraxiangfangensis]
MTRFTFNLGGLHFEQVTSEELHKVFKEEAERIANTKSAASA